jgi:hypothetical protein
MTNPQTPKKPSLSPYGIGKYGLAIDWETTGSDFNGNSHATYQGISFGAIIFDTNKQEQTDQQHPYHHIPTSVPTKHRLGKQPA